jgi:MSHA pilin protein MshD
MRRGNQKRTRAGFTLAEALLAVMLTAVSGSALLLGIAAALDTTETVVDRTVALGLAERLMDEISTARWSESDASPYPTVLGPESGEAVGSSRTSFDDLDDYNGLDEQPPRDRWGFALGSGDGAGGQRSAALQVPAAQIARWRQLVEVYYVSETDGTSRLASGQTSDLRAVEVRVYATADGFDDRLVADLRRIFVHVPGT